MAPGGEYLYGFTDRGFQPPAGLAGLRGVPVRLIGHGSVGAVVSRHPVQRLMPLRANLEPHHRVVRHVSGETTLVPAAFGHISASAQDLLEVLRENHDRIREELDRLDGTCEMGLKLSWNVGNIFAHFVSRDRELRELRDRVFRDREPSMPEKLQVGELFAARLTQERERLSKTLQATLEPAVREMVVNPPRSEHTVCDAAILLERRRVLDFAGAMQRAATMFDASLRVEYSGPWPAYSFVRIRLQQSRTAA